MSQCIVPNWNLRHQKDQEVEGEGGNRSYHVDNQRNPNHVVPMSSYEVAELTWENGQLAMHGLGGLLPAAVTKPAWGRTGDTLESIVHQATTHYKQTLNSSSLLQHDHLINVPASNISSNNVAPSGRKWSGTSDHVAVARPTGKRRSQSESDRLGGSYKGTSMQEERTLVDPTSACASFCRDNDTTNMTWASFESPQSMKTKTADEDSAYHGEMENQDEKKDSKGNQTGSSNSKRRSRAADIHNQSERRRRDRINQKMKALQKLVPNASKTDKASMLDEVIEYLKQLQAQVHMMSVRNNMSQMMMPLGMQQQMQMSLMARMAGMGAGLGMGMGMGMLDMSPMPCSSTQSLPPLIRPASVATSNSTFLASPFMVPQMFQTHTTPPQPNPHAATDASVPFNDAYCAFLAQQSMNMDLYNKMAAVYQQQVDQGTQAMNSPSKPNHVQGD